jgi:ribonucleoside-diphosphate reductase alpha chain
MVNTDILVTKRNGSKEPFILEKIHRVLEWATEEISGVSISEIELKANLQLYTGIPAYDIHELLIRSAADLITEDTPNYQFVAARLINYKLRKEVYGQYEPWSLSKVIEANIGHGVYDPAILEKYSPEEINELDSYIRHDRDNLFSYAGMEQFRGKYLAQDRSSGVIYETPQILYMMVAATLFGDANPKTRMRLVKDYYDMTSQFYISLPTPIMAGARTPVKQFSSCVLIESGDSLDSIIGTVNAVVKYVSKKAGIGVNAGAIRAEGSKVGDGSVVHTGIIPFLKLFQASVKSCSQGGVRGGAATVYYPIWHLESEDLLVLKNNKGTESNRVRHMDYGVQLSKLFYERLLKGEKITLFSPHEVPDLYDAFFQNQDLFRELYEKYERSRSVRKRVVDAAEHFESLIQERQQTGRVYIMNVDNSNEHSSFDETVAPVRMSNLCTEITLPTKPVSVDYPDQGEIALCTLSAINWGLINKPEDFEKPCRMAVEALDALLDYQEYPVSAAERATKDRRPLGVGIINLAYFLAKRGLKYDQGALETVHEYAEAWSYYLIKASADIAARKGACPLSSETKYQQGRLPIDTYKRSVDDLVEPVYRMPWDNLRAQLQATGIRNSTLMACMPAETSAQISNATNGVEPPRALVSYKQSKHGALAQVVPGIHHLKNRYDLLWEQPTPEGYLMVMAVLQKFIDQAISVNTSYNPKLFEGEEIPYSQIVKDILFFYKTGGKCLYYANTNDGAEDDAGKEPELEQEQVDDAECESCVI